MTDTGTADKIPKIVAMLGRMAVFKPLKPPQLEELAKEFVLVSLDADDILIEEGDESFEFYILFSGRLLITRQDDDGFVRTLGHFISGDHFGEEAPLYGTERSATISAETPSVVLQLSMEKFGALIENYPDIIPYFITVVESRRQSRGKFFDWLGEDETIYLLVRKHQSYLAFRLLLPFGFSFLGWPFVFLALLMDASVLVYIFGGLAFGFFAISLAWMIWQFVDWGNDYYIVTNQRVVWLEKVVALYDSREEAPLGTVVAVNIQSDQVGRMLGYGDVLVRTITGAIPMRHVGNPAILAGLVNELVDRGKITAREEENVAIEVAIRKRLGLDPSDELPSTTMPPQSEPRMSMSRKLVADFFKMRYEEGSVITFRKHWIVLIRDTFWPSLLIIIVTAFLVMRILNVYTFVTTLWVAQVWFIAMIVLSLGWFYGYVDWRNDIYQLTENLIIDIYKKPLGEETKKTASIDNILSLQHSRRGILRLLLNYGDVNAEVGVDRFTFNDVFDPSEVEREVFHRIAQRRRKQHDAEIIQQREYIADWLAAYHRQVTNNSDSENSPEMDEISG